MSNQGSSNIAALSLRAIFFILLISLGALHVTFLFKGLDSAHGMEQAAIAREVARGNGLVTKVIRPAAIRQTRENIGDNATLADASQNTYHAPLKPLLLGAVFRAIGANDFESFRPDENEYIYQLDRVVAGFAIVCLLLSIGVTYLLVCRIFDSKIAGATALLMLFCELFWTISMSGLPQMLMLLLFTSGCYFAYRSIESSEEEGLPLIPAILAAIFFALLCLTHWIAIWLVIGYAVAAAMFIKPRGLAGIIVLTAVILAAALPVIHNIKVTGNPGGTAVLVLFEGLSGAESWAMRSLDTVPLNLRMLTTTILKLMVAQTTNLYAYFGSIVAAPIFFIALFHPFKKISISHFRWTLLIMWVFSTLGMAIFGLKGGETSPNQLHLLFAPLMGAYGLAMLSVLWARLQLSPTAPFLSNAHLVLAVAISASPFLLRMPFDAVYAIRSGNDFPPNYPPYAPSLLDKSVVDYAEPDEIIASDQPWAVAWYTDRRSLWIPMKLTQLEEIENIAEDEETPIVGVILSPISSGTIPLTQTARFYGEYMSLMLDGWASFSTSSSSNLSIVSRQDSDLKAFYTSYPQVRPLIFRGSPMIFYTSRNSNF